VQKKKPYKLVVFDLDGTLVDSERVYFDVLDDLLAPYNLGPSEVVLEKTRIQPPEKLFDKILGEKEGQVVLGKLREIDSTLYKKVTLFQGVMSLLESLKEKSVPLALWTARDRRSAQMVLDNLDIAQFFPYWVSGSCVEKNKPSSEGLLKIANHFEISPQRIVMVGDHEHDLIAGNDVDSQTVHARWKPKPNSPSDLAKKSFASLELFANWMDSIFFSTPEKIISS